MEIRQLRHVLALAETRNFGRAAEVANLTQQALSHSIAQLEKDLQVRLFDRGPFGAQLTDVGEAFVKRARLICAEIELASREVAALRGGEQGEVAIGASSGMAATLVPKAITRFTRNRPKIAVSLTVDTSSRLYERLLSGDLELVIATPMIDISTYPEIEFERIDPAYDFQANFLLMRGTHPLLEKSEWRASDLVSYPWIMPQGLGALPRAVFDWLRARDVPPPTTILRTDSIWGAKWLLLSGDFLALTGRDIAHGEIEAGILGGFPLPGLDASLPGYFAYRKRSVLQPAAADLLATARLIARTPGELRAAAR